MDELEEEAELEDAMHAQVLQGDAAAGVLGGALETTDSMDAEQAEVLREIAKIGI